MSFIFPIMGYLSPFRRYPHFKLDFENNCRGHGVKHFQWCHSVVNCIHGVLFGGNSIVCSIWHHLRKKLTLKMTVNGNKEKTGLAPFDWKRWILLFDIFQNLNYPATCKSGRTSLHTSTQTPKDASHSWRQTCRFAYKLAMFWNTTSPCISIRYNLVK